APRAGCHLRRGPRPSAGEEPSRRRCVYRPGAVARTTSSQFRAARQLPASRPALSRRSTGMESSSLHCRGEVTSCWRPCASRSKPCAHLQRPQESNQVRLLLVRQAQPEADIEKVACVEGCAGRAVVEVRGATGEAAQDGTLEAADVLPLASDECPARGGTVLCCAGALLWH